MSSTNGSTHQAHTRGCLTFTTVFARSSEGGLSPKAERFRLLHFLSVLLYVRILCAAKSYSISGDAGLSKVCSAKGHYLEFRGLLAYRKFRPALIRYNSVGRGSTALVRVPPRVCLENNLWQRFAVALRMDPNSVGRLPLRPLSVNDTSACIITWQRLQWKPQLGGGSCGWTRPPVAIQWCVIQL